jgi:NAD(P)H-hydrate repair Nnr-like enzyme with NAD(P)H-hydrate dehydratase domain
MRPPFDPIRASFYLVASVIAVHCVVVLVGAGVCVYEKLAYGTAYECDAKGRLGDLLAGVLAAAIAFSGGFARRPPGDKM